jgi:hypothetical protein
LATTNSFIQFIIRVFPIDGDDQSSRLRDSARFPSMIAAGIIAEGSAEDFNEG